MGKGKTTWEGNTYHISREFKKIDQNNLQGNLEEWIKEWDRKSLLPKWCDSDQLLQK